MCEDTSISYEEPSPNTFSFNSPYGACPVCKGLGSCLPDKLWRPSFPTEFSINEGGIAPLGEESDNYIFKQVQQLAKKNKFSLDIPVKDMPEKALNLILYGDESEPVEEHHDFDDELNPDEVCMQQNLKDWYHN